MSSNRTNGGNGNKRNALSQWTTDPRWSGITRPYSYSDVLRLRGSIQIEYTLARLGAPMFRRSEPSPAIKPLKWCRLV